MLGDLAHQDHTFSHGIMLVYFKKIVAVILDVVGMGVLPHRRFVCHQVQGGCAMAHPSGYKKVRKL